MSIHYPKLHNMVHTLSVSVFIAFKGINFIFNCNTFVDISAVTKQ